MPDHRLKRLRSILAAKEYARLKIDGSHVIDLCQRRMLIDGL